MEATSSFVLGVLKAAFVVTPVTIDTTASYQYSPNMSQVEACQRAEDLAKTRALQKAFGQQFGTDSTMSCRETDKVSCDSIQNVYEETSGYVDSIISRKETVRDWSCTVDMTVKVKELRKPEPNVRPIEAQATLDRVVYTQADTAKLVVESVKRTAATVFVYDPVNDVVVKIYPSPKVVGNKYSYPDEALRVGISMEKIPARDQPYYLLILATNDTIGTLDRYRLHEFHNLHDNIPNGNVKYIRKSFYVSRSKI